MKICIDARSLGTRGILSYSDGLMKKLLEVDRLNEYVRIVDSNGVGGPAYDGVEEIPVPSQNPMYWFYWSNAVLPRILRRRGVDVYHSFKHITAFWVPAAKLVTIHGIHSHYFLPQYHKRHHTWYWKSMCRLAVDRYDRIITVSESEKNYLVRHLGYPPDRFRVTHLGADDRFREAGRDPAGMAKARRKYGLPDRYLFFAGKIDPIKNIEGMIRAYREVKRRTSTECRLVLAGDDRSPFADRMKSLTRELGIERDVRFLGYLSDELPFVFNLAEAYLFPSCTECFPVALVEAMSCGLPLISSDIDEIREVVGDAGILVDPNDVGDIARAIETVITSESIRASLRERSLERVNRFSWENCAKETLSIYEELQQRRS